VRITCHNITYTKAGVSCFVGQESGIFGVQFFVGSSVVKNPCLRIAEKRYKQAEEKKRQRQNDNEIFAA
jgi:hypothetical protein